MTLATTIQDRTNDGTDIVDFLLAVMRNELAGFKSCHRLAAAGLLVKYDCDCKSAVVNHDGALDFILNNPREPSRPGSDSGSTDDSYFDAKLAKVIQDSTDDGRSVCRFLINVMDGELKAFKPHHRITAARELLSRGFGKHAYTNSPTFTPAPAPLTLTRTLTRHSRESGNPWGWRRRHSPLSAEQPTNKITQIP